MDYSAFVLAKEASRIAMQHAAEATRKANGNYGNYSSRSGSLPHTQMQPLFLYMAMQSVHEPFQAPDEYINTYTEIGDLKRRTLAAMVTAMDEAIGIAIDGWKEAGLWDDTILVFRYAREDTIKRGYDQLLQLR
jgi:arylsulfatase A-like enzyme